jgi:hypothetical protein
VERFAAAVLLGVTIGVRPLGACNPEPPLPPILEDHDYDAMARDYLIRESRSIALGRFVGKLEFRIQGPGPGNREQPDYVFEISEGWKEVVPVRLVVPGYWVSCDLPLKEGASFLFYLQGSTPLFIIPAAKVREDLEFLGDLDWFYSRSGQLIRPDILPKTEDEGQSGEPSG